MLTLTDSDRSIAQMHFYGKVFFENNITKLVQSGCLHNHIFFVVAGLQACAVQTIENNPSGMLPDVFQDGILLSKEVRRNGPWGNCHLEVTRKLRSISLRQMCAVRRLLWTAHNIMPVMLTTKSAAG